ncbi:hypothetical protein KC952_03815 [Candidatus Saccharibacteria bacterium]|nr:hypothetical protein [Candidatus Saccharibacteria bacterium]
MKQKLISVFAVLVISLIVGAAGFLYFYRPSVTENFIVGTVTSVTNKPNLAEDGYYGFEVKDNSGNKYTINATGYMNIPRLPGERGGKCVDVPMVKTGDKVEFNLPKAESQANTFDICYEKSLTGYYFKLD